MAVTGLNRPDFRTISEFRKRHLAALSGLLVQVLRLCQAAGLVKLGDVAVDGSKLEANASKHKAMSYQHMVSQERTLAAEVQACLDQAAAAEAAEDAEHGEARGAETPPDRAQRNVTDPGDRRSATGHSRIMPSGGDFIAGDNGQIAVDAANQVIVAQHISTNPADDAALTPLVEQSCANLGRKPREVSADSGFATEANLAAMAERGVRADLSPGRIRHGKTDPTAGRSLKRLPRMQAMAETIRRAGRRSRDRLRKQGGEPVFGHIKQARGFRQFLLRGLTKLRGEWAMICTAGAVEEPPGV
jgi:hypothetical protein